ncbi:ATP-binding protein [Vibrio fluvialis]|nr:ATP-binding protein [Vibrio fluvialis]MBY8048365.1 ATP-binding protein [Vibrio fluvialis]MBY8172615.1 ATP-binding protein [Vibrio fluvialis]
MIIELAVTNHLSIKDEQVFSLYAQKSLNLHSSNILFKETNYPTLATSGIFGANGSGKTNLLSAFNVLQTIIVESDTWKDGDDIPVYFPYLLSEETRNSPTSFDLEFWLESVRYKYSIKYNANEIIHESLYFYPASQPAKIFERTDSTNWKDDNGISFGGYYKGGKKRFGYFANNSFLSKAGNEPDAPQIIRKVYNYFRRRWGFVNSSERVNVLRWEESELALQAMKCLMNNVDLGISDFDFKERDLTEEQISILESAPARIRNTLKKKFSNEVEFLHMSENGKPVPFDYDLESLGTRRLFEALPMILLTLKHGSVLFCDEIESSFHTHVVELIIKLFQDPYVNKNSAQLIFTSHNIGLMDSELFRKDQLWLSEKKLGKTEITSLDQFDSTLRDTSPFQKWYNEGRLGGIPAIDTYKIFNIVRNLVEKESSNA